MQINSVHCHLDAVEMDNNIMNNTNNPVDTIYLIFNNSFHFNPMNQKKVPLTLCQVVFSKCLFFGFASNLFVDIFRNVFEWEFPIRSTQFSIV